MAPTAGEGFKFMKGRSMLQCHCKNGLVNKWELRVGEFEIFGKETHTGAPPISTPPHKTRHRTALSRASFSRVRPTTCYLPLLFGEFGETSGVAAQFGNLGLGSDIHDSDGNMWWYGVADKGNKIATRRRTVLDSVGSLRNRKKSQCGKKKRKEKKRKKLQENWACIVLKIGMQGRVCGVRERGERTSRMIRAGPGPSKGHY